MVAVALCKDGSPLFVLAAAAQCEASEDRRSLLPNAARVLAGDVCSADNCGACADVDACFKASTAALGFKCIWDSWTGPYALVCRTF